MRKIEYIIAVALLTVATAVCGCRANTDDELLLIEDITRQENQMPEGTQTGEEAKMPQETQRSKEAQVHQESQSPQEVQLQQGSQESATQIADGISYQAYTSDVDKANPRNNKESNKIYVYVCGAVNFPNVCSISSDSRMVEAIEAAGGFADNAAKEYLNLAGRVADGQKIYVPTYDEIDGLIKESGGTSSSFLLVPDDYSVASDTIGNKAQKSGMNDSYSESDPEDNSEVKSEGKSGSKLININTADASELTSIPGVGEAKAKKIIDYREENGGFGCIEDIMLISGIKEGMFNKIKDYICVE